VLSIVGLRSTLLPLEYEVILQRPEHGVEAEVFRPEDAPLLRPYGLG